MKVMTFLFLTGVMPFGAGEGGKKALQDETKSAEAIIKKRTASIPHWEQVQNQLSNSE